MAGHHSDEYEGQVTLSRLARSLEPDDISGHLVLLPMSGYPAARPGRRTSPIDEGNLNRNFPGDTRGTITQMIEEELRPEVYLLVDVHSVSSSLIYLPST